MIHNAGKLRSTTHRSTLFSCIVNQQEQDLKPRDKRREHKKKTVQFGINFNGSYFFDRSLLKVTLWHGTGCVRGLVKGSYCIRNELETILLNIL